MRFRVDADGAADATLSAAAVGLRLRGGVSSSCSAAWRVTLAADNLIRRPKLLAAPT